MPPQSLRPDSRNLNFLRTFGEIPVNLGGRGRQLGHSESGAPERLSQNASVISWQELVECLLDRL